MDIKTQTITMRQGNKSDYQPSKMLSGELAVINDAEELHFSPKTGKSIRVATENDIKELENKIPSGGGENPGGNGGSIVVDSYLSETSTNPVQNKVVAKKFSELSGQISDLLTGGTGLNSTAKNLLITILRNGIYSDDQSANITALETALSSGGNTEQPESGIVQTGSILAITSGVTATQTGSLLAIA